MGELNEKFENQDKVVENIVAISEKGGPNAKLTGLDTFSNPVYGMDEEELMGLNLVDSKRMHGGLEVYDVMDKAGDLKSVDVNVIKDTNIEIALSGIDYAASS